MASEAVVEAVPVRSTVMVPPGSSVARPPGSIGVAVPMGEAKTNVPMWQQEKQGAKCCGCCCDYRRAVIVLAVINICISIGYLVFIFVLAAIPGVQVNVDDDVVTTTVEDNLPIQAALYGVSLFCSLCALAGANMYNIPLVALNTLWYVGSFIGGAVILVQTSNQVEEAADVNLLVIPNIVVSAVITMLFMYPHIGFMYEVKVGIMSAETYPREEYSCCCVASRRL